MSAGSWLSTRLAETAARILHVRPLMRAPVRIYRAGAGALLGSRLLMLEHTGRKTGTKRNVVLEVIGHPAADRYLVASGFGDKAQWFRNIQADPRVRVYNGSRPPQPAIARVLTPPEAGRALSDYAERHPRAWNRFRPVLERTLGHPVDVADPVLPIVELRLG